MKVFINVIFTVSLYEIMNKYILCVFVLISQNDACLDVLIRSVNEIFSPIVETGNGRVEEPHDVDELTHLYRHDENGNLVLRPNTMPSYYPYVRAVNPKISKLRHDKNIVGSLFNQLQLEGKAATPEEDTVACHKIDGEKTDPNSDEHPNSITDSSSLNPENNVDFETESPYSENVKTEVEYEEYSPEYEEYEYHPRGGYTPGRRPFLDLIIKLLETFQLTATSEFIQSRPRYAESEYHPKTDETYK